MKVSVFDRILMFLLALFVICIGIMIFVVVADIIGMYEVFTIMPSQYITKMVFGIGGGLMFIIALRVMAVALKRNVDVKPTAVHLQTTENGSTFVSLSAIDAMVQKHCRANQRIKECASVVTPSNNGVKIALRLMLSGEANIPELTLALQQSLKQYVESLSGIVVDQVSIVVVSTPTPKMQVSA